LESLLRPVDSRYRCTAFRAANWSMHPSRNAMDVLQKNGFVIESSVFKWGSRSGLVDFDYSDAPHSLLPWRASVDDVCREDPQSGIWEFPIYAEALDRSVLVRLYRAGSVACIRLAISRTGRNNARSGQDGRGFGVDG
jgi:hypothetical protein